MFRIPELKPKSKPKSKQGVHGLLYVDNLSQRGMFTTEDPNVFAVIAEKEAQRARRRQEEPVGNEQAHRC